MPLSDPLWRPRVTAHHSVLRNEGMFEVQRTVSQWASWSLWPWILNTYLVMSERGSIPVRPHDSCAIFCRHRWSPGGYAGKEWGPSMMAFLSLTNTSFFGRGFEDPGWREFRWWLMKLVSTRKRKSCDGVERQKKITVDGCRGLQIHDTHYLYMYMYSVRSLCMEYLVRPYSVTLQSLASLVTTSLLGILKDPRSKQCAPWKA